MIVVSQVAKLAHHRLDRTIYSQRSVPNIVVVLDVQPGIIDDLKSTGTIVFAESPIIVSIVWRCQGYLLDFPQLKNLNLCTGGG